MHAERVAAACLAAAAASGRGAPHRETADVGGVRCVVLGVREPWGGQVVVMAQPDPRAVTEARSWTLARAPGCVVLTRERYASEPAFAGLERVHDMPALVLGRHDARAVPELPGVTVGAARDPDEYLAVFGRELEPLVTAADLADPALTHLVARRDGVPVAVAMVRVTADAACVSGVTVAPEVRRTGLGTAISVAATNRAVETGASLVWLHATAESRPIYEGLGYRQVDLHLQLS